MRPMMRGTAVVIMVVIATLGAEPAQARAQARAPTGAELVRANALFEQAAIAYAEQRWGAVVALLLEAHSISGAPVLIYNLGRAYEGAGERERALEAYRRYLREAPHGASASAALARVQVLSAEPSAAGSQGRLSGAEPTVEESTESAHSPEPEPGSAAPTPIALAASSDASTATTPWIVTASGGLALVAGAVLAGFALERRDAAERAERLVDALGMFQEAETFAMAANVLFIAGGAVAALGLVWGIVVASSEEEERPVQLEVALGPGQLSLRGTFE